MAGGNSQNPSLYLVDHNSQYEICAVELQKEGHRGFQMVTTYYSKADRFSPGGTVCEPVEFPELFFGEAGVEVKAIFQYLDEKYQIMRASYHCPPDERYCLDWEKRYDLNQMCFL